MSKRLVFILVLLTGCLDPDEPGALVPPTAAEDPALPQVRLTIEGAERALHLETFGDPSAPAVFVLHGGPGADYRLMLPLKALADRFFVVMWDQRGAGLSERVPADELTLDSFDSEIALLHQRFAPGRPISLVGHSFGGDLAIRYAARRPDQVARLALLDPGLFTATAAKDYEGGRGSSFLDPAIQDAFWQNEYLSPQDHAAADYKVFVAIRESTRNFYCDGEEPDPYVMWRYGAVASEVILGRIRAEGDGFAWTEGIEAFDGPISIIAGSCGALGAEVQRAHNLPVVPRATLTTIDGAGHVTLFTRHAAQTLAALREALGVLP